MSFVKKYFTCSDAEINNCKKSILHLSAYSKATVDRGDDHFQIQYTLRTLKEIVFIQVTPNIFEIDFELREKCYLTNCYMFAGSDKFCLFEILDEYMTDNYSTEYWEIIEKYPHVNLYCSCTISVRSIGKKRNVFVNQYLYNYSFISTGEVWFKSIWRRYENEDFNRIVCCGPDKKLLNDMVIETVA